MTTSRTRVILCQVYLWSRFMVLLVCVGCLEMEAEYFISPSGHEGH